MPLKHTDLLGFEVIDQSNLYLPGKEKFYENNISKINENNPEGIKEEAYQKSSCVDHKGSTLLQENLNIALINVLEMAKEYNTNNLMDSDKVIGDESIRRVQEFLGQIKNNFKSPEETNL